MTDVRKTPTPSGLAASGRRLWRDVIDSYDLDVHEQLLLTEACRVADRLDRLAVEAADNPVTSHNMKGDLIAHPAMVEARQQAIVLSRLVASLRLPSGETADGLVRPQRRGAARGSYGIRGAVG
jgi:hypothetical protein